MDIVNIVLLIVLGAVIVLSIIVVFNIKKRIERKVGMQFKSQIERHFAEVEIIYLTMRGWRHDYHNHIQTIKGHVALSQHEQLDVYLNELDKDLERVDTQIKTGNIMIDAILSSKVSLAENHDIAINIKAQVDEKLTVSEIDMCVIIGNLIDNAIDANLLILESEKRFIRIYIAKLREQLYITVTNATGETLRNETGIFISQKGGMMHGHGLRRVDMIVSKYNGFINRQNEPGVFATEILLPL